jgi:hypothetical protein
MKRSKLILFIGTLFFLNFTIHAQKNTFKVMAWNILHGGNDIENGPENVGKIINEINPDIILMIETYGFRSLYCKILKLKLSFSSF